MAEPTPESAQRALRVLSLAYFVQAVGALSVIGALQAVSTEWALADAQSAFLVSVFGATFAVAAPLMQVVLGHLRRRLQVLLGLVVFSAAAWLFAAAPSYSVLLASRVLMGLGAAFIGPVLGALGSSLVRREAQGSAIATVLLGLSLAGLVGMPVAAWAAHAWGARGLFVAVGVAGFATAGLVVWLVPNTATGEKVSLRSVGRLLADLGALSSLLVAFFMAAGVYTTYTFLSPILRDTFHSGPPQVSAALAVLGVAGVLGNLFVKRAARRYSAERMLFGGLLLLAIDMPLLYWSAPQLGWLFVALTLWAFATDILWPSQQRRVVELAPTQRGILLALTASFVFLGIGAGSAVGGWIYPHAGFLGLLLCTSAFLVLAALSLQGSLHRARRGMHATA